VERKKIGGAYQGTAFRSTSKKTKLSEAWKWRGKGMETRITQKEGRSGCGKTLCPVGEREKAGSIEVRGEKNGT